MINERTLLELSLKLEDSHEDGSVSVKICNMEEELDLWQINAASTNEFIYYLTDDMNLICASIDLICDCSDSNTFIRQLCKGMVNYG